MAVNDTSCDGQLSRTIFWAYISVEKEGAVVPSNATILSYMMGII